MTLSYANQFIDLLLKSMDWFLYDNGLRQERVKGLSFTKNCLRPENAPLNILNARTNFKNRTQAAV